MSETFLDQALYMAILLAKIQEAKHKTNASDEKKIQQMIDDIMVTKGW